MKPNEICDLLADAEVAPKAEIKGCTEAEIDRLQESHGVLPASYAAFLLAAGHGAGRFLAGTEAFYRSLPALQSQAAELLAENGLAELPEGAFVFYMHQGYEFGYFLLNGNDDPPVFQYVEGSSEPEVAWPSFTAYLTDVIHQHQVVS